MTTDIDARIIRLVGEQLGLTPSQFSMQSRLVADLQMDSLDSVELTMGLEDEFGIEINYERATECETLAHCAQLVQRLLPHADLRTPTAPPIARGST